MHNSLWLQTAYRRDSYPAPDRDVSCNVCIIGEGSTAIAYTYLLAKAGKHAILTE